MNKEYFTMDDVGRRGNYIVNFHDGVKTHRDGSEFYDMRIFRNKRKRDQFIRSLKKQGYVYGVRPIYKNPRRKKRHRVRKNSKRYGKRRTSRRSRR